MDNNIAQELDFLGAYKTCLKAMETREFTGSLCKYYLEITEALRMAIRPKSKWIETIDSIGGNLTGYGFECPCCRLDIPYKTKFCPDCGADMRG